MIPKKRQIYNFFDDGKCSPSRLYKAYIKKVIPFNKADIHLKIHLVNSALDYDWIWNGDTDYFVGCYIPKYDNHLVWFARNYCPTWRPQGSRSEISYRKGLYTKQKSKEKI